MSCATVQIVLILFFWLSRYEKRASVTDEREVYFSSYIYRHNIWAAIRSVWTKCLARSTFWHADLDLRISPYIFCEIDTTYINGINAFCPEKMERRFLLYNGQDHNLVSMWTGRWGYQATFSHILQPYILDILDYRHQKSLPYARLTIFQKLYLLTTDQSPGRW